MRAKRHPEAPAWALVSVLIVGPLSPPWGLWADLWQHLAGPWASVAGADSECGGNDCGEKSPDIDPDGLRGPGASDTSPDIDPDGLQSPDPGNHKSPDIDPNGELTPEPNG